VKGKRRSLHDVSKALAAEGYVARSGKPFESRLRGWWTATSTEGEPMDLRRTFQA
jgi:hypothetical protein